MALSNRKGPARKSKTDSVRHPGSSRKVVSVTKPVGPKKYEAISQPWEIQEPEISYTSRIRPIGNSRGVILNSEAMASAGLNPEIEIVIQAAKGLITIVQVQQAGVNTDLSTWDKQFKAAIKNEGLAEKDPFGNIENDFDSKEW